jgi:serine/threonine kinase PknH
MSVHTMPMPGQRSSAGTCSWVNPRRAAPGRVGRPQRAMSRSTCMLLAAGAALLPAVALIALVATVGGGSGNRVFPAYRGTSAFGQPASSTGTGTAPTEPVAGQSGLMLDAGTLNKIMRASGLTVIPSLTTTRFYADTTDKPECGGVWANANRAVYAGTGWLSVQTQYLREPGGAVSHEVFQSVIRFASAAAAANFVAKEAKSWPACNGRHITTTAPNAAPQTWWISSVSKQDDVLTALSVPDSARGWGCQHALTARDNAVIDVEACGRSVIAQASTIAKLLANRVR